MRLLLFVLLSFFVVNAAGQSPAVTRLFRNGTAQANEGRFADALKSYKTALFAAENEYLSAEYLAKLHYNIGVCHFRLERFDLASDEFKKAILLKKEYTRAHYALGMAESRKKNWKAARASFRRVLDIDPKNGEAWFDLAFSNIALKEIDKAATAFVRSIEFSSVDSALSHNNIGVILAIKGELAAAEKEFESAIAVSGGWLIEAKRNLAFCREQRAGKRLTAALEYTERRTSLSLS